MGLLYLFALLYATENIDATINGTTENATINLFVIVCGAEWGAVMVQYILVQIVAILCRTFRSNFAGVADSPEYVLLGSKFDHSYD